MCFKKLFGKPDPVVTPFEGDKLLLSFAINNYPGSGSDLNGCLNDQKNLIAKITTLWPEFKVRKFSDSEVTKARYIAEVTNLLKQFKPGDTLLFFMDSCFSEDNTRALTVCDEQERFHVIDGFRPEGRAKKRFLNPPESEMKYLSFSMCQDYQTSSDAYISGTYQGAGTFAAIKSLHLGITYRQWVNQTTAILDTLGFDQIPALQGPEMKKDQVVGTGRVFIVQYSGHGTQLPDNNGDEQDGYDEALYLYDGALRDDEIAALLNT